VVSFKRGLASATTLQVRTEGTLDRAGVPFRTSYPEPGAGEAPFGRILPRVRPVYSPAAVGSE
jgi:hypothetical protein